MTHEFNFERAGWLFRLLAEASHSQTDYSFVRGRQGDGCHGQKRHWENNADEMHRWDSQVEQRLFCGEREGESKE